MYMYMYILLYVYMYIIYHCNTALYLNTLQSC